MKNPLLSLESWDPQQAWSPWKPDAKQPFDLRWAGHLYRRAAFGGTWTELQTAVKEGPDATIDKLLQGGTDLAPFNQMIDKAAPRRMERFSEGRELNELQGLWLYRMLHTPHPLLERMTLFWHNHFATSIAKVQQPSLMKRQNLLLRRHALGQFRPFVLEMSRDPAMLIWLDSNSNVKGRPNENYARELMELFTLGVGHYTESDVREAARAFTGWHTNGRDFSFSAYAHDDGAKTVLGKTGTWDGSDVVRIVLDQPAAARFLVRKLYRHFVNELETPEDSLLEPLAERFRRSDYDILDLMRTVFRSRHFFSEYALKARIKSPVEYVLGLIRSLEGRMDAEGALPVLAQSLDGLGQTLFAPPTVKGWDGGKAWLNSATILARHNLAWRLLSVPQGPLLRSGPTELVQRHVPKGDCSEQVDFLVNLLLQPGHEEVAGARQRLIQFLAQGNPRGAAHVKRLRETAHGILLMPEYQLA
jgi:uncharacterized protein (DUF1800 family)